MKVVRIVSLVSVVSIVEVILHEGMNRQVRKMLWRLLQ